MIPHLGKLSIAVRELNHSRVAEKQSCRKANRPRALGHPFAGSNSVSGGPLCPRLRPRRANHSPADPRDAGTRHPVRLGDRLAGKEIDSGSSQRERRERPLEAGSRRQIDVVRVWRLDRWGRWVMGLRATFQELGHLGVRFASLTEALDLTTPAGRAMAGVPALHPPSSLSNSRAVQFFGEVSLVILGIPYLL
jgi:hypothetical protein